MGIAFSVGFTVGPPLGAYFASINLKEYFPNLPINAYSSPALFALVLIVVETIYMLIALPETLNKRGVSSSEDDLTTPDRASLEQDKLLNSSRARLSLTLLSWIHFLYLFVFSGMEFTLTFLSYDRYLTL